MNNFSGEKLSPLFFDIEAGGFFGRESPILSIGWAQGSASEAAFAKPKEGLFISPWAKKHVLGPILKKPLQTEQEVLEKFLGRLKSLQPGTEVTGWNIGYDVAQQPAKGYDIPMVMTRAKAYGLQEQFSEAFGKLRIRDIGQEYAWRLSKELRGFRGMVGATDSPFYLDPALFEQTQTYRELGESYLERGVSEAEVPKKLALAGKRVSGWKQEIMAGAFGIGYRAHEVEEDVRVGQKLLERLDTGSIFKSQEEVVQWGERALQNMLVTSAISAPRKEEIATGRYEALLARAQAAESAGKGQYYKNFVAEFESTLQARVKEAGGSMKMVREGFGMGEAVLEQIGKTVPSAKAFGLEDAQRVTKWLFQGNRKYVGIGVGVLGLYAMQPGSWFSGKDDAYNTIEGLPHGGQAQQMRRALTDFGSGFIKKAISKVFQGSKKNIGFSVKDIKELAEQAQKMTSKEFAELLGVEYKSSDLLYNLGGGLNTAPSYLENKLFKAATKGVNKEGKVKLKTVVEQMKKQGFEAGKAYVEPRAGMSWKKILLDLETNPGVSSNIKEAVKTLKDVSTEDMQKTIIFHEAAELRNVTAIGSDKGMLSKLNELGPMPQHQMTISQEELFLRSFNPQQYKAWKIIRSATDSWFSGFDDSYNTIEGLKHGGLAEPLRKVLTDFGSGWDALRGLVRASETFGEMLAGKSFQQALKSATRGEQIGEGMFGTVWEMTGKFRGQEFKFARKMGRVGEYEVQAMRAAQESITPTVYASEIEQTRDLLTDQAIKVGTIDMELFQGTTIESLPTNALEGLAPKITSTFKKLHQAGFEHGDPHLRNIMKVRDAAGKEHVALIDLGNARRVMDVGKVEAEKDISIAVNLLEAKKGGGSQLAALDPFAAQGNQFSGFDDAYNTIEGIRGTLPKPDFGSGWKGIIKSMFSKDASKILKKGISIADLQKMFGKWIKKEGVVIKAGKGAGAEVTISRTGEISKTILYDPEIAARKAIGLGLSHEEAQLLQPVFFGHEISEVARTTAIKKKGFALYQQTGQVPAVQEHFGSHISTGVIDDELMLAAGLGKETYQAIRKFRFAEATAVGGEYGQRMEKILSGFEKEKLHQFGWAQKTAERKLQQASMQKAAMQQSMEAARSGGRRAATRIRS